MCTADYCRAAMLFVCASLSEVSSAGWKVEVVASAQNVNHSCTTLHFFFTGPPAPPTNLKVLDSTKSSVTLGWTKPVSDGGAPLIGYVVEMRVPASVKKGEDGWKRCNVAAQLVVCEFTVTSLDEKLAYEFRVSAQNQVGMSLSCDLEGVVIPKDILGEDSVEY